MKGVYFLLKGDDVIYIGQSANMERRIIQHRKKDYDFYVLCPCENRFSFERRMIKLIKPLHNIRLHIPMITFLLRIQNNVYGKVSEIAAMNKRSVNKEIAISIEEKYL